MGVEDRPGIAYKVFSLLGQQNINVDIILQSIGRDESQDISFTVRRSDVDQAVALGAGMGGGVRCGSICGAVSAPVMLLGTACPDPTDRAAVTARVKEYQRRFTERFHRLDCRELLRSQELEPSELALELAGSDRALERYFRQRGGYDRVLDAMDRGRALGRGRLSPEAVQALYGRSLHMSASRMDQVKRCHFGYFMQYGLRARERRPAGFEAPEIGTFIHYLLENVAREVKNRGGWSQVEQEELRRLVWEDLDQAMILGLEMSIEELKERGVPVHRNTLAALEDLQRRQQ